MNQSSANAGFRFGRFWIFSLSLMLSLLCGVGLGAAQPPKAVDQKKLDSLRKAYQAARTQLERRAVCLDAIDSGVIALDRPVAVVDAIFGTTYAAKLPPAREEESGYVAFQPSPPVPKFVQAEFIGWYFVFDYDSAGKLRHYYLSNSHRK